LQPKFHFKKNIIKLFSNATVVNVFIAGLSTFLVSGMGFFKEMIIADKFGLSELLDTFLIAILVPSFISGVFLGSFHSVFIPNYVSELKTGKRIGAFQSTSFLVTTGVAFVFLIIAYLFTDVYLETFLKGHNDNYYALIKTQFYFVSPCILFWGFTSVINGLLTIDSEFKYSSASTIFTPISIIICIVFFREELGTLVLAIGTLIGSISGFIFILNVALKRGVIVLNRPDFKSKNIKTLFRQLPAKLSASLISGVNPLIDQFFAAQLIVGSIAALNYGIKIPAFTISIVGIAIGNVLLPYFSKNAIDNKIENFKKLNKILKFIFLGSSALMIIVIIISKPVIKLIFEGNAFESSDTEIVFRIQQMYLLQVPFYIAGLIMVKFLTSINKNNFMVFTSIVNLILNISLNYILIKIMGVYGLALGTSIVATVNCIILYVYINYLNKNYV
jgi:putative peptidoglycan lipid II flippase